MPSSQPRLSANVDKRAARLDRHHRREWLPPVLIFLVALSARIIHLIQARDIPIFKYLISDGRAYDLWAQRIAAGDWIGDKVFYQAPLYPYFLGALYSLFTRDLLLVRIVQSVLGALSCILIYQTARNLFDRRTALIAGLLYALYTPAIYFDGIIQKTALDGFFMSLLLWLLTTPRLTAIRSAAAGIALSCLILTRENAAVLIPITLGWIITRAAPRRLVTGAAFTLGLVATLLPVAVRNKVVSGEFHITTSQFGPNFYIGNHAGASGAYDELRPGRGDPLFERTDAVDMAETALDRSLTPGEVSKYWSGKAFTWIASHPGDWLKLLTWKCVLLLNWYEIPDAEDQYFYEKSCSLLRSLGHVSHFGIILPPAVLGIVLTWNRRRELWLLPVFAAALSGAVVLFFVVARYRFSMVPVLVLLAAAGLTEALARIKVHRSRSLITPVIATLVAAVVSNWPISARGQNDNVSYFNAGVVLFDNGRVDDAIAHYQRTLALKPDMADAHLQMGIALANKNRLEDGLHEIRQAETLRPDDPWIALERGSLLAQSGQLDEARAALKKAANGLPREVRAFRNLAVVSIQMNDWPEAVNSLRRAAELQPRAIDTRVELAWLLAACPSAEVRRPQEAMDIASSLCKETNRRDPECLDALATAHASAGQFEKAMLLIKEAVAQATSRPELIDVLKERERRYQARQPPPPQR
jgi:tetratricopeptide (TPR) repeat protein